MRKNRLLLLPFGQLRLFLDRVAARHGTATGTVLQFNVLRDLQGIIDLHAKVPYSTSELGMTQQ